jgi:hypothetical protein
MTFEEVKEFLQSESKKGFRSNSIFAGAKSSDRCKSVGVPLLTFLFCHTHISLKGKKEKSEEK